MAFMPQNAPLVVLTFLGACFALGLAAIAIVYAWASRKRTLSKYALGVALAGAAVYAGLLLVASLASREKVLEVGEQKYFCEVDCHIAYSVVDVGTSKALGAPPGQVTPAGVFYVVRVRTWFDPRTISAHRGNGPLRPGLRRVFVVDDRARRFGPSAEGGRALEQANSAPLTQPLRPGESYTTEFVFDLPPDIRDARLLIADADGVAQFLIGHENSPFHKKIFFRLAPRWRFAAVLSAAGISP